MNSKMAASYLKLFKTGELEQRLEVLTDLLRECQVCPQKCGVNRMEGKTGCCKIGSKARVSSFGPHFGEEAPLRGWRGSGTIFFGGCNLACVYCQNAEISQGSDGREVDSRELGQIMLELQEAGCHNINLVSPSHVVPQIVAGLIHAADHGLRLPLVYNTGGYDSLRIIRLLDGIVDIYLPDMKYCHEELGKKYSGVPDYPSINQQAVLEMHRQVGDLELSNQGIALRGLLIRHLILPENLAGTRCILEFVSRKISRHTYLNLMDQYRPAYRAGQYPELTGRIGNKNYLDLVVTAAELGLNRLDGFIRD
jgi:putative pyruvate formate lyase activating enzyme